MKSFTKHTAGVLILISFAAFFLWDRNDPNGFWWTGFVCLLAAIFSSTLVAVLEKGWVRFLRVVSILGIFLNSLVVVSNGGRMPVMFVKAGRVVSGAWKLAMPSDHFSWLCDRFPVGPVIFSIGDVLLIGGMLAILFLPKRFKV